MNYDAASDEIARLISV